MKLFLIIILTVQSQRYLPYGPVSDAYCDESFGTATSKTYSNFEMALSKCEQYNCDILSEFEIDSRWRYELGKFVNPESSRACSLDSYSILNHFISQYDTSGNELGPDDIRNQREANKLLPKYENSGRSLIRNNQHITGLKNRIQNYEKIRPQQRYHNHNFRNNQPQNRILNCDHTSVCDIIINNPLQEAFKIMIKPMAEVRFIESIRNGTHLNIGSIQPSSIWLSPQSQRNRVSFLCLPGGIGHIQHISVSNAYDNMVLVDHQVVYGREYTLYSESNLYFLIEQY